MASTLAPAPKRIAMLCSGNGSNFKALYQHIKDKKPAAEIALCLSNRSACGAMVFASSVGIETVHLSEKQFATEEAFGRAMLDALQSHRIDYVFLAGYLKKMPTGVVAAYRGRMLNIHPALLPKFGGEGMYGMRVHEAVIAAGETESGATIHFVDEGYDTGEIFLQRRVPVLATDTAASLANKVLAAEHLLYAEALEKLLAS